MSLKIFVEKLREHIKKEKNNGNDSIRCDELINYLDDKIEPHIQSVNGADLEKYKAELQVWVENSSNAEMFRSVLTAGQNAIRSAFLLNGGAAIAMLAFIAKLTDTQKEKVSEFAGGLAIFVTGVLIVAITSGLTYLSQWFYAGDKEWEEITGFVFNISAIVTGLLSYGFFIWGMSSVYINFVKFV